MPYTGSYLWRLRQEIGNELVLMPGAMIALRRSDGKVLLTRRADDGTTARSIASRSAARG